MRIPYSVYRILSIWSNQINQTLPKIYWNRVSIIENGELLTDLVTTEKVLRKPTDIFPGITTSFLVRETVAEKIYLAARFLPQGLRLGIIEGFRSMEKQKMAWDEKWQVVKQENPNWNNDQIDQEVGLVVARPAGVTNHVCGGAVDVCLVNDQGEMLDFGTEYAAAGEASRRKCSMFAKDLTTEQKTNRKILRNAMESAGFVWYPGEWWHYCYGDRMWAVYTGQTECRYGPVKSNET